MNTPLRTLRNNLPMRFATWKQWNPVQNPARSSRKRWDECSVFPIWETLWISAIVCNINFFLETKKPAFYSKVCSAKRMLVKYESGNENQNVIRLKNIIMEANWKINAKFQHKPNAMFRTLLVLTGKINALLPPKSWRVLAALPGTATYLSALLCPGVFMHYSKSYT